MSNYELLVGKIKEGHSPEKKNYSLGDVYSITNEGVQISISITKVYNGGWENYYGICLDGEDVSSAFCEKELESLATEIKKVYVKHSSIKANNFINSKFNQNIESLTPDVPKSYWKYGDWSR